MMVKGCFCALKKAKGGARTKPNSLKSLKTVSDGFQRHQLVPPWELPGATPKAGFCGCLGSPGVDLFFAEGPLTFPEVINYNLSGAQETEIRRTGGDQNEGGWGERDANQKEVPCFFFDSYKKYVLEEGVAT